MPSAITANSSIRHTPPTQAMMTTNSILSSALSVYVSLSSVPEVMQPSGGHWEDTAAVVCNLLKLFVTESLGGVEERSQVESDSPGAVVWSTPSEGLQLLPWQSAVVLSSEVSLANPGPPAVLVLGRSWNVTSFGLGLTVVLAKGGVLDKRAVLLGLLAKIDKKTTLKPNLVRKIQSTNATPRDCWSRATLMQMDTSNNRMQQSSSCCSVS